MSKNVIVTDGNYKITVPDNNSIVLDTGTAVGTVEITGNLLVKGTQTTVNSATLEIDDNIIVVNKNESANLASWLLNTLNPINHLPIISTLNNMANKTNKSLDIVINKLGKRFKK